MAINCKQLFKFENLREKFTLSFSTNSVIFKPKFHSFSLKIIYLNKFSEYNPLKNLLKKRMGGDFKENNPPVVHMNYLEGK